MKLVLKPLMPQWAVAVSLALASLPAVAPPVAAAAPCLVDDGFLNAADWNGGGFPGATDAPLPNKFWGPDNTWHDMWLAEWCEPDDDWLRDRWIRWDDQAINWIRNQWTSFNDFMDFEQVIADEWQYNNRNTVDSNLPWVWYYVADIFEQASQHYDEAGWWMKERSPQLAAGVNYFAHAKWDQEKSPLDPPNGDYGGFRKFLSQAEELKADWFARDGVDPTGKSTAKKFNQ